MVSGERGVRRGTELRGNEGTPQAVEDQCLNTNKRRKGERRQNIVSQVEHKALFHHQLFLRSSHRAMKEKQFFSVFEQGKRRGGLGKKPSGLSYFWTLSVFRCVGGGVAPDILTGSLGKFQTH